MLTDESIAAIERFWAADLGCTVEELRGDEVVVTRQGGPSIFIFTRRGSVVSVPSGVHADSIIGPAFIGYADAGTFVRCDGAEARPLVADDGAIAELRAACDPREWEHGGPAPQATARIGVFDGASLAALASYEKWGDRIAHISIVTHPAFRGRGFARIAVGAITQHALDDGLVAQYRTLVSNTPSLAIARRLRFHCYAVTVAIRLSAPSPSSGPPG